MNSILLKALALTVLIFVMGIYAGFLIDNYRIEETKSSMTSIDNLWNDARLLQTYIERLSDSNASYCDFLLRENLIIGDKIYEEGLKVEENEKNNRFVQSSLLEKERYALLDLQFWLNSVDLRSACNANYSTVIYLYSHYNRTVEQDFQDRTLLDFKQECGDKVIYITFPSDIGITTLNVIKSIYNITSIPAVIIDESTVLYSPVTKDDLEGLVNCS